jgi:hypothetical protein
LGTGEVGGPAGTSSERSQPPSPGPTTSSGLVTHSQGVEPPPRSPYQRRKPGERPLCGLQALPQSPEPPCSSPPLGCGVGGLRTSTPGPGGRKWATTAREGLSEPLEGGPPHRPPRYGTPPHGVGSPAGVPAEAQASSVSPLEQCFHLSGVRKTLWNRPGTLPSSLTEVTPLLREFSAESRATNLTCGPSALVPHLPLRPQLSESTLVPPHAPKVLSGVSLGVPSSLSTVEPSARAVPSKPPTPCLRGVTPLTAKRDQAPGPPAGLPQPALLRPHDRCVLLDARPSTSPTSATVGLEAAETPGTPGSRSSPVGVFCGTPVGSPDTSLPKPTGVAGGVPSGLTRGAEGVTAPVLPGGPRRNPQP